MADRKATIVCLLVLICCAVAKSGFVANTSISAPQPKTRRSSSSNNRLQGQSAGWRFRHLIRPPFHQTILANVTVSPQNVTSNRTTPFSNLTSSVSNRTTPFSNLTTSISNRTTPFSNLTTSISNRTTPFSNLTTSISNRSTPFSNLTTSISNRTTPFSNMTSAISNRTTPFSNLTTSISNRTTPFSNLTSAISNRTTPFTNLTTSISNQTTPFSNLTLPSTTPPSPHYNPRPGEPYGCHKVSPCVCETEDGARVDLTPLASNNGTPRFKDVADYTGLYYYSWNPCYNFNEGGACTNVAVCQIVPTSYQVPYYNLGSQETVDIEVSSDHGLMLQYTAAAPNALNIVMRITNIQLRCDPTVQADFTAQGEPVPQSGVYYFTLRSRYACLTGGDQNTTTSSVAPSPRTPPIPSVVTVTSGPTPNPVYSLKTVVDLLFVLTMIAAIGLVVLLMVLVAVVVKRRLDKSTNDKAAASVGRKA